MAYPGEPTVTLWEAHLAALKITSFHVGKPVISMVDFPTRFPECIGIWVGYVLILSLVNINQWLIEMILHGYLGMGR